MILTGARWDAARALEVGLVSRVVPLPELMPAARALADQVLALGPLAVKLAKAGKTRHLGVARDALADPSRTVRYFAGLQVCSLGPEAGKAAVPVLREILAQEKDEDLVERAKLCLLRLDRTALAEAPPEPPRPPAEARPKGAKAREAAWVRVRIYEKGASKPGVSINLPVALADLVFKALPDDAVRDLKREGYDARTFWEKLKQTGPAEILTVEGDDGERIQVWIE